MSCFVQSKGSSICLYGLFPQESASAFYGDGKKKGPIDHKCEQVFLVCIKRNNYCLPGESLRCNFQEAQHKANGVAVQGQWGGGRRYDGLKPAWLPPDPGLLWPPVYIMTASRATPQISMVLWTVALLLACRGCLDL